MTLFDDLFYVGIVGSRRRVELGDFSLVREAFMRLYVPDKTVIVSGGCPLGGDRFAEIIATELGMPRQSFLSDVPDSNLEGQRIVIHFPDKSAFLHVPDRWRSTRANYHRNGLIARDSRDALIAVLASTRGGTDDTVEKFEKLHRKRAVIV